MILAAVPAQVKIGWFLLWTKMGWVDVIFLVLFGLGILLGLRSGLAKVLPRLFGVIAAQIITIEYAKPCAEFLEGRIFLPPEALEIILFALFAVASILLIRFLFHLLSFVVTFDFKPPFNNAGGAVASGVHFILLLGLIASFLSLFPLPFIQRTFTDHSLTGGYLAESSQEVHDFFIRWLPRTWRTS